MQAKSKKLSKETRSKKYQTPQAYIMTTKVSPSCQFSQMCYRDRPNHRHSVAAHPLEDTLWKKAGATLLLLLLAPLS